MVRKIPNAAVNIIGEEDKDYEFSVYSEPIRGLLYSRAIPNVISNRLAKRLRLQLSPAKRRNPFAERTSGNCMGTISNIPVRFIGIIMRLDLMVVDSVPYDSTIDSLALV